MIALLGFLAGVVFTAILARFHSIRCASDLLMRAILFPFHALASLSTTLLALVGWLLTGEGFSIERDSDRREKFARR
ncbi:hypothetical protein LAV_00047 [Sphingobium phage Lacusarx]|uniref:Uncharacterized protein n=1 Tax=Sphingobium phage Lacusarx TaxID=1980139 RepID=A0A1W6DWQ1_9CAUD|nr:hypothetical protein FDH44_gp047 [Sphingobium phage Lacusarx]ARK07447.1 hypothetical protein LAV_00047 [Sphingobium phage Lacusarx]